MNTLKTDKKYTVILSAYQDISTPLQNMVDTDRLHYFIEHNCHLHAIRAVGVYKGGSEQSFVIHTNSSNSVSNIKRHVLIAYSQECVLISNNRKHDIKLHGGDGNNTDIGKRFIHSHTAPKRTDNYTVLNGTDYYIVE